MKFEERTFEKNWLEVVKTLVFPKAVKPPKEWSSKSGRPVKSSEEVEHDLILRIGSKARVVNILRKGTIAWNDLPALWRTGFMLLRPAVIPLRGECKRWMSGGWFRTEAEAELAIDSLVEIERPHARTTGGLKTVLTAEAHGGEMGDRTDTERWFKVEDGTWVDDREFLLASVARRHGARLRV